MFRLLLVSLSLYMLFGHSANAQTASQISTSVSPENKAAIKKYSISADLSNTSNLRQTDDPDYESTSMIDLSLSIKAFKKASVVVNSGLQKKLYADEELAALNTTLSVVRDPIALNPDTSLNISVFGVAPTNEVDREDRTLNGAAGLALGVKRKHSFLKATGTTGYALSLLQNFHTYERTNEYAANLQNRARHTLTLTQNINKNISLELMGRYQTGQTYQGALRTYFALSQQLNYAFNDLATIYIAHSNEGNALKANGVDSDIRAYDANTSAYTAGLTVTY